MSDAFVFSGPTLSIADIPASVAVRHDEMLLLENGKKISFMPPVSEGDILKILNNAPDIIAIIDGYFENTPSVWHKEILYAMKNGVHVLGASSMGALRAAELAAFGMEGVGKIYKYYASGDLQDDDEVTITHGPRELGYA